MIFPKNTYVLFTLMLLNLMLTPAWATMPGDWNPVDPAAVSSQNNAVADRDVSFEHHKDPCLLARGGPGGGPGGGAGVGGNGSGHGNGNPGGGVAGQGPDGVQGKGSGSGQVHQNQNQRGFQHQLQHQFQHQVQPRPQEQQQIRYNRNSGPKGQAHYGPGPTR